MPHDTKDAILRLYPVEEQHDWDDSGVDETPHTDLDTVVAVGGVLWLPLSVLLVCLFMVAFR